MPRTWSMTTLLAVAALFAGLVACGQEDVRVRTVFTVTGMHCDGCSASIVSTLEKIEGVDEATADHEKGVAEAVYLPREIDVEELKTEIEKLGYTVIGMRTEAIEG